MTVLEYVQSHNGGETLSAMLLELQQASMAGQSQFASLPATRPALAKALLELKSSGHLVEVWPTGAKEGVWRVASGSKVKAKQPELFA
jgi:hypothetical protein